MRPGDTTTAIGTGHDSGAKSTVCNPKSELFLPPLPRDTILSLVLPPSPGATPGVTPFPWCYTWCYLTLLPLVLHLMLPHSPPPGVTSLSSPGATSLSSPWCYTWYYLTPPSGATPGITPLSSPWCYTWCYLTPPSGATPGITPLSSQGGSFTKDALTNEMLESKLL